MLSRPLLLKAIGQVSLAFILQLILVWMVRQSEGTVHLFVLWTAWFVRSVIRLLRSESKNQIRKERDSAIVFSVVLIFWQLGTAIFVLGDPVLYPTPGRIASLMAQEFPRFLDNFRYSLLLLVISFTIGLVTAFPLGMLIGSNQRVRQALSGYIKVLSLISPIAYIPYIVGIMPTFRAASIFVIFTGTFWPILKWTIFGLQNLDRAYPLNAELLHIRGAAYYRHIVIPAILPSVLSGVSASISGGFGILVAAEMIGSRRGLGFAIKYFADFLNYHMVLTNIIYLGIAILIITWLYEKLQASLLIWQVSERKGARAIPS